MGAGGKRPEEGVPASRFPPVGPVRGDQAGSGIPAQAIRAASCGDGRTPANRPPIRRSRSSRPASDATSARAGRSRASEAGASAADSPATPCSDEDWIKERTRAAAPSPCGDGDRGPVVRVTPAGAPPAGETPVSLTADAPMSNLPSPPVLSNGSGPSDGSRGAVVNKGAASMRPSFRSASCRRDPVGRWGPPRSSSSHRHAVTPVRCHEPRGETRGSQVCCCGAGAGGAGITAGAVRRSMAGAAPMFARADWRIVSYWVRLASTCASQSPRFQISR